MITEIHVTSDELNALNKKVGGIHMPKPLTNEEWLKSMNTEQFAEALAWIEDRGELPTVRKENVKAFEKWLKEKHNG